jgi:hypothetical protein
MAPAADSHHDVTAPWPGQPRCGVAVVIGTARTAPAGTARADTARPGAPQEPAAPRPGAAYGKKPHHATSRRVASPGIGPARHTGAASDASGARCPPRSPARRKLHLSGVADITSGRELSVCIWSGNLRISAYRCHNDTNRAESYGVQGVDGADVMSGSGGEVDGAWVRGGRAGDGLRGLLRVRRVIAGPQGRVVWRWITSQGLFSGTM